MLACIHLLTQKVFSYIAQLLSKRAAMAKKNHSYEERFSLDSQHRIADGGM